MGILPDGAGGAVRRASRPTRHGAAAGLLFVLALALVSWSGMSVAADRHAGPAPRESTGQPGTSRVPASRAASDAAQQPDSPTSDGKQSPGKQSPGRQSPAKKSPGKQSPGEKSPGKQSPGEKRSDKRSQDKKSGSRQPRHTGPTARPGPDPEAITVPALRIDQDLVELAVTGTELQVPDDYDDVGWWRDGPAPGEHGAAVMVGHVDSTTGPAVFYQLSALKPGYRMSVRLVDGSRAVFEVRKLRVYDRDDFPSEKVYRTTGRPQLHLVTCGGPFDLEAGQYTSNVVAFADLVRRIPAPPARRDDKRSPKQDKPGKSGAKPGKSGAKPGKSGKSGDASQAGTRL